jgi:putative membrane protein
MRKALLWVAAAANGAVLVAPSAALAQAPSDRWGQHMMWWGGGWYGMILGPLFMIVGLALAIALALALVRWLGGQPSASPPHETALEILRKRFARGDIDKEEYAERRRLLGD